MDRRCWDVVSCIWEQTTGCWWGRQLLSQKQVAPQSHRHERQGKPKVRTHALWSPLWQPGSWALIWRVEPLVEVRLPEYPQPSGWEQLPAFDNSWVVSRTTILPVLLFSPSFIICIINSLHGTPSPVVGFCFPNQSSLIQKGVHRRPQNHGGGGHFIW